MDNVINLRLLSHPVNYFVVGIVLAFVFFAHTIIREKLSNTVVVPSSTN